MIPKLITQNLEDSVYIVRVITTKKLLLAESDLDNLLQ